jgi:hypothetical protein
MDSGRRTTLPQLSSGISLDATTPPQQGVLCCSDVEETEAEDMDSSLEHVAFLVCLAVLETKPVSVPLPADNDPTDEFAPNVLEHVVYNDEGRGAFPLLKRDYGTLNAEKMIAIAKQIPIRGANVVDVVFDAATMRLWVAYAKGNQEAYERPFTLIDLLKLDADGDGKPDGEPAFAVGK